MASSSQSDGSAIPVLARLAKAIRTLAEDHLAEGYEALLEADIVGWLFHLLVTQPAKAIVKKPVAVYIEKVYEEGNFAGLGIGT